MTHHSGPHSHSGHRSRSIMIPAILLFAAVVYALHLAAAQAQDNTSVISNLTLTSETPGAITATWNRPGQSPTDYRVNWAKSDEEYPSWTSATAAAPTPSTSTLQKWPLTTRASPLPPPSTTADSETSSSRKRPASQVSPSGRLPIPGRSPRQGPSVNGGDKVGHWGRGKVDHLHGGSWLVRESWRQDRRM